jgi:hypothetical protein
VSLDERVQLPTLEKLLKELVVLLGLGCALLFLEIKYEIFKNNFLN